MRKISLLMIGIGLLLSSLSAQQKPVYLDVDQPLEDRVEDALKRMTLEEKVAMLHAQSKFSAAGVPRLGIPENWTSDGPHGIRTEVYWDAWESAGWTNDSCIAFPALTCLAATWNPEMAALFGKSIGEEARYRNKNILLAPGVNIFRTPLNGRNFEYMGEDPYLASRMVVPYIKGVQQNGVAACVKHFALNNQEVDRFRVNVIVDDRALHEIYLPAFKAAVHEGETWSIMGAYNKYKGEHCCHNQYLLNNILKRDWGFDGVVVSDWGGVHDTRESVFNGLDMEFGTLTDGLNTSNNAYNSYYLADPYLKLIRNGEVGTKELDDKVRRILRLVFRTTMSKDRPFGSFGTEEHGLAGRTIAEEGIVLLQNKKNTLPIDLSATKKIVVVGENAIKSMTIGGGSSRLKAKYEISPLEGIKRRVGNAAEVVFVQGYESQLLNNPDDKGLKPEMKQIDLAALRREAVNAVKGADVVLFIGGLNKNPHQDCEGADRLDIGLPYEQDQLIDALVKANPNVVVVMISGTAVSMPWVSKVPSIVQAWYNGSEAGNALASVLFGDVNPSGKLPFTFPVRLSDNSAHALDEYPGNGKDVKYNESIFVGYRWTDKEKIKPLFSFGHGLSYTTFEYGKPELDRKEMSASGTITCSVKVKNTGSRRGKEIVQFYISDRKSSLPRPEKELKGFEKIELAPGEEKTIKFTINKDALSFYDDRKGEWVAEPGQFDAIVAASATDIKGKISFNLK
jgi:beta-glucosidase